MGLWFFEIILLVKSWSFMPHEHTYDWDTPIGTQIFWYLIILDPKIKTSQRIVCSSTSLVSHVVAMSFSDFIRETQICCVSFGLLLITWIWRIPWSKLSDISIVKTRSLWGRGTRMLRIQLSAKDTFISNSWLSTLYGHVVIPNPVLINVDRSPYGQFETPVTED